MKPVKRQLAFSLLLIVLVIAAGTTGYTLLEGWQPFESLYMTIITITTVGYREIHPLSNTGMVFTILLETFA